MALGEQLVGKGLISKDQLETALDEQKKNPGERLGAILVRLGFVTKEQIEANL